MHVSKISIVLLAAGTSSRFGPEDKLSLPFNGRTILDSVVQKAQSAGSLEVVLVASSSDTVIPSVLTIVNVEPQTGLARSIALGVSRCNPEAAGFLIWPADMPLIQVQSLQRVADAGSESTIVRPILAGPDAVPGHPVFFGRAFRNELESLTSGPGARIILKQHPEEVREIILDDPGIQHDVDTPSDYATALKAHHA